MRKTLTILLVMSLLISAIPFVNVSAAASGFTFSEDFEDLTKETMPYGLFGVRGEYMPGSEFAKVSALSTDGIGGDWTGADTYSGTYSLSYFNPEDDGNAEYFQCLTVNGNTYGGADATDSTNKTNLSYLLPVDASEGIVTATYRIKRRWPNAENYNISTLGVYVGGHATRAGRDKVKAVLKMNSWGSVIADGTVGGVSGVENMRVQAQADGWDYFKTICTKNDDGTWTIQGLNLLADGESTELINVKTEVGDTIAGIGIVCPMEYINSPWGPDVLIDDIKVKTTQSMGSITEVGYMGEGWNRCFIGRDVPLSSRTSYFGVEGSTSDPTGSFVHDVDITIPGTTFVQSNIPSWGSPGYIGNYDNSTLIALFQDAGSSAPLTKGTTYQINYRGLTYDYTYMGETVVLTDSELGVEGNDFEGYTLSYATKWRAQGITSGVAVMAAYKDGALKAISEPVDFTDPDGTSRFWNSHTLNLSVNVPNQASVDEVKVFFFDTLASLKPLRPMEVLDSITFPE